MSLFVIRWFTELQMHTLFVLINSIEPKLRQIVSQDPILVIHSYATQLDLELRWILTLIN
jgi:hypothetical protein